MTVKWMQTKPHQTEQMNSWLSNGCTRSHTKQNKWIHDCQMDAHEATPNRTNEFMTVKWMHTKPHQTEQMNSWLSNGCRRSHTKQKKWIHDCQMDADEATPNRTNEFMTVKWMQTKPHQTEKMNSWLSNGCRRSHTKQNKWIHDCQMDADEATPNRKKMNSWLSNGCTRSHTKHNKWIHHCQMDAHEATPNRTNELMTVKWMQTKPHQTEHINSWLSNGCRRSHTKQNKWIHDCQMDADEATPNRTNEFMTVKWMQTKPHQTEKNEFMTVKWMHTKPHQT